MIEHYAPFTIDSSRAHARRRYIRAAQSRDIPPTVYPRATLARVFIRA